MHKERMYALDWLRIGSIIFALLFHSAAFFTAAGWIVKNSTVDPILDILAGFIIQWNMPLTFVVSGASAWLALQRRTPRQFVSSKVLRLLLPLVFGILVLAPPQVYLERLTHHQFSGSFFAWLPRYFDGLYGFGGNFAWMGMHLWYLLVLLFWTYVTLPLCLDLINGRAAKLAAFFARPGMVFLLIIPLTIFETLIKPGSFLAELRMGGYSPFIYVFFYLAGFLIPAHEALPKALARQWWVGLLLGIVIPAVVLATGLDFNDRPYLSLRSALIFLLREANAVCWVVAVIGGGLKFLTFRNRFLDRASEAVLPFYMLHQTVLLIIGYFVIQWPWPNLAKFATVALATAAVNVLIYLTLIRPFRLGRFLFGMRQPRPSAAQKAA